MALEIKTAAEVIALDLEGRGAARRAARETGVLRRVLRSFVEAAGPVRLDAIVSAFPAQSPERVLETLARLDEEDLVRIVASENGRSGLSIGGSSRVRVDTCTAAGNGAAQFRMEGFFRVQLLDSMFDAATAPAIVKEGGMLVEEDGGME